VVVAAGETVVELPVTVPIPLMESEVAPETVQDRVELTPGATVAGFALNAEMTGGETFDTVTLMEAVTLAPVVSVAFAPRV
jgi:hypothetical protein